jgi:2,3-diketo-5-methylthiopentyl-1-phosphate enolase
LYPSQYHGIAAPLLLGKLMRLAGADLVLFPSPYGSVVMPREENLAIDAALKAAGRHRTSFSVPSAGIHPGLTPAIIRDFGQEVVVNAGGGIHGHPMGTAAGGRAFRQAIDAVMKGVGLRDAAQDHEELRTAIERWGMLE